MAGQDPYDRAGRLGDLLKIDDWRLLAVSCNVVLPTGPTDMFVSAVKAEAEQAPWFQLTHSWEPSGSLDGSLGGASFWGDRRLEG